MKVRSMTGYGKLDDSIDDIPVSIEIRTVNNRYLETSVKLSKELFPFENNLKKAIGNQLNRGSVALNIQLGEGNSGLASIQCNQEVVSQYLNAAAAISSKHGLDNELTVKDLLHLPEVFSQSSSSPLTEDFYVKLEGLLSKALDKVVEMREAEGENLKVDLEKRIEVIAGELNAIEKGLPERLGDYKARLKEKVTDLLDEFKLDESRLAQEVAYMVDKMDITEELVRFQSHNKLFLDTLAKEGPHGKKLNFLLQEMGREANTLATKSHFVEFQHRALRLKEEIEAMREQVQNIE